MFKLLMCCFLLGTAGQAIANDKPATERSAMLLVGNGLVDMQSAQLLEKAPGKIMCYRSFQHNSLLKKLKCRQVEVQDVLAEKE
ncbi:MAG: hypothetical protein ACOH5I_17185 [Oligoflexus sp.]